MTATSILLGWVVLSPAAAPVPADPPPDPLARGYLGATFDTTSPATDRTITSVTPGQPADKAGLKVGDEVVRVGTYEPKTFPQLLTHICSFRPGATVEVEVLRGGERKVVQVTLTARPKDADRVPVTNPNPFLPDK
ncbi:MAG: PDZ domain-containing protein, partial [Gemmataceae bacterium]|nr:PDZ domain-containing protein [Gemmataceae bacterium]